MERMINLVVVHCADTPPDRDVDAAEIRRWHTEERGWSDIGYHWVIKRDGEIEPGRPEERNGAHVKGHNKNSIGVCLVGGGHGRFNYTWKQLEALGHLLQQLAARYPSVKIRGHCDLDAAKTCPNFDLEWFTDGLDLY